MTTTNLMTRPQSLIGFRNRTLTFAVVALFAVQPGRSCVRFAQPMALSNFARTLPAIDAVPARSVLARSDLASDDAWRRTSVGWQRLPPSAPHSRSFEPSLHISLAQTWPAAWAACMLLSILALAECDLKAFWK